MGKYSLDWQSEILLLSLSNSTGSDLDNWPKLIISVPRLFMWGQDLHFKAVQSVMKMDSMYLRAGWSGPLITSQHDHRCLPPHHHLYSLSTGSLLLFLSPPLTPTLIILIFSMFPHSDINVLIQSDMF